MQPCSNGVNVAAMTEIQPYRVQQANSDEELFRLWLGVAQSKHTLTAYQKDLAEFLRFVGGRPIGTVTLGMLQDYRDWMVGRGLKVASINRRLASIRSLFGFAYRIGYIPFNVAAPLKTLRQKDQLPSRCLTEEQAKQFIEAFPYGKYRTLARLLYECGLRIAEALGLDGKDVVDRPGGGQITVFGKGGKTRTLLISRPLMDALQKLIASPDEPVFRSNTTGGRLTQVRVRQIFKRVRERAGLPPISAHWLRHTHASLALENGCPLKVLQDSLGHADLSVTSRYIHSRPNVSSSQYVVGRKKKGEDDE